MLVDVCMCICKLTSRFYFAEIAEENGKNMEKNVPGPLPHVTHTHTKSVPEGIKSINVASKQSGFSEESNFLSLE